MFSFGFEQGGILQSIRQMKFSDDILQKTGVDLNAGNRYNATEQQEFEQERRVHI